MRLQTRGQASQTAWAVCALVLLTFRVDAQERFRPFSTSQVVAGNVVIGAATAGLRAYFTAKPVRSAVLGGMAGGAIHAAGKFVGSEGRPGSSLAGGVLASIGNSVVSNAVSSERGLLSEIAIPVAFVTVRLITDSAKLRATVYAYDVAVLTYRALDTRLGIDWQASAVHGTFVFRSREWLSAYGGGRSNGSTDGAVIIVSDSAPDPRRTLRHEAVHVQQYRFMRELWGRPLEHAIRRKLRLSRWPAWLDLGMTSPVTYWEPLRSVMEREAEYFERSSDSGGGVHDTGLAIPTLHLTLPAMDVSSIDRFAANCASRCR